MALPGLAVVAGGGRATGDRSFIAFTTDDGVRNIAVVPADGSRFRKLTHNRLGGYAPFWTSDGGWLVFLTGDHWWRVRPDGSARRRLPGDPDVVVSPSGRLIADWWEVRDLRGKRVRSLANFLGRLRIVYDEVWSTAERYLALTMTSADDEHEKVLLVRTDGKRPRYVFSKRRGNEEAVSFSPDGRWLLTFLRDGDRDEALLASVATGQQRELRGGIVDSSAVTWSPDSRRLAYLSKNGGVYVTRTSGGSSRLLARSAPDLPDTTGLAWSPHGDTVALCDGTGLHLIRVIDGRARSLTKLCRFAKPSWRPNGRELTFSLGDAVYVVRATNGHMRRVLGPSLSAGSPQWAPNNQLIAFVRGTQGLYNPTTRSVYVVKPDGTQLRRIGRGQDESWSRDSRHLVFVRAAAGAHDAGAIIVAVRDGRTREVATGSTPSWSPAGAAIAYVRQTFSKDHTDPFEVTGSALTIVAADGTGSRVLVQTTEWGDALFTPLWSPDGSAIAVREQLYDEQNDRVSYAIGLVDPTTGSMRSLPLNANSYRWSPDSTRLLLWLSNARRLQVVDVASGSSQTITADPGWYFTSAVWSPDGRRIAYTRERDQRSKFDADIWTARPDGTDRRRIAKTAAVEAALAWAS